MEPIVNEVCDLVSERGLLGAIFQFGGVAYHDVSDIVSAEGFVDETNQMLFRCFESIFKENPDAKPDIPTILSVANNLGFGRFFERSSERQHIRAVLATVVRAENARKFAQIIRKLQIRREAIQIARGVKKSLEEADNGLSVDGILALLEKPIFDFSASINGVGGSDVQSMGGDVEEYLDHIESNPRETLGISTGFKYFDEAIGGGLRRKTVNLVGSRVKTGKTFCGDNIALFVASKLGIPVLNLDTEMDREQHQSRLLACLSAVKTKEIETGKFAKDPQKRQKVRRAAAYLKTLPYDYVSVAGRPFEEILSICRRWIMKRVGFNDNGTTKDCLIVYDYMKMMSADGISHSMQEYQMLGFMMTSLVNFCIQYDVPCLSFIQLNRDGISKESQEVVSGSDRQLWTCANFSIFKEKTEDDIAQEGLKNGNRKLVPIVCRHGAGLPGDHINFQLDGDIGRLTELGLRSEMSRKNLEPEIDEEDDVFANE